MSSAVTSPPAAAGAASRPVPTTRATVMFADIVGFTDLAERVGPERAYFAVTGALRTLDGVARRHGGSVDKYLGDCLLVVFGYPVPLADAPRAAAAAALEMQAQMREYVRALDAPVSLHLVIGVNTGFMVAGDVRTGAIREFNVLGDAVNVAARLKAKAPRDAIYVGPETHAATADAFDYEPLGSMPLKGKKAEVSIFKLRGTRAGHVVAASAEDTRVPFVGRAEELARLRARVDDAAAGRGGVVVIVGDDGMGKSRLVAELGPGAFTVIEDADRMNEAARGALVSAVTVAASGSALVVLTSRPNAHVLETIRAAAAGTIEEIALQPLSRDDSARVIDAVARDAVSDDDRETILAYAGGRPARLVTGTYLAPALRAERDRGHTRRSDETERRRATILFADITGFTTLTERMGAERAYPIVAGCLRLLDEIATAHGGTVDKYLGDCVMALFGVPEAIEDAPRAAVNAAIEMRRRVRVYSDALGDGMRLDVHSGINTGLGIAGDISGPLIREFAVMGDPVSVADELKDLAPAGQIYVGQEVYRATRDTFEYRELDTSVRERRATPIRVFELLSDRERLHRARIGAERRVFSPLVGREKELDVLRESVHRLRDGHAELSEAELAMLRDAVERLREGGGALVAVIGAAGLGKSRLLAELTASDEARAVAWCEGRSRAAGQHLGFHTIADLCRSLATIADADDDGAAREKLDAFVRDLLAGEADEVLPFLASMLGLPLPPSDRERVAGLHGDALEKLIVRGVTQLLRAASERRPTVVVLDDLHWADLSSIGMIESVIRLCESHSILFIPLFRPGFAETSERIREHARKHHPDREREIALRPLESSAARTMLKHLFRRGELPHDTRRLIEERAQGNPFYIEEVIRALVDEGAVVAEEGAFRVTDKIATVTIPGSIHEVVMARVDRLDPPRRQLLQTASVIGGAFEVDVLAEVLGHPPRLGAELEALVDAEFLVGSERLPGAEYAFKHRLIQEVTYEGLLQARREELHRSVGAAMERVLATDHPGYAGMLAFHYGKGGDVERAETFLFRAGAEAARAAAPSEALHFFEQASKLYLQMHADGGDPAKRAVLEKNIAQALYYRGRFLDAVEHFNRALRLLGDEVVEGRLALGARFVRNLGSVLLRLYGPRVRRRRGAATEREREIMELRYARAEATVTSQPTRHLFDSMDTLAFLQRVDPASVPQSGKFYAGAAALFAFGGISFDVSRRFSDLARTLVDGASPDEYVYERAMHFAHRVLHGDWSEAHEIAPERIAESVRNGQLWGPTTYLGLLAEKRIHRGDLAGARESLAEIDRIWDLFQYDLAKTNHYYIGTLLPLEEEDWAAAIDAATAYYDENPEDLLHILALGAKAKAQTHLGDLDAAEETLAHAAEVVARSSPVPPFHVSSYHRSRFLLDVARLADAVDAGGASREKWTKAARRSGRAAMRSAAKVAWRRPEVLRLRGRYERLIARAHVALRWLDRSVSAAEALGMRPEMARGYADAARVLATTNGGRAGQFRGLDATACAERARATKDALVRPHDLPRLAG